MQECRREGPEVVGWGLGLGGDGSYGGEVEVVDVVEGEVSRGGGEMAKRYQWIDGGSRMEVSIVLRGGFGRLMMMLLLLCGTRRPFVISWTCPSLC